MVRVSEIHLPGGFVAPNMSSTTDEDGRQLSRTFGTTNPIG